MKKSNTQLDADELFHFALQASQNKENAKAVSYLKQAIDQSPDNARLHFLLGAQHADLGMYERAIEDMSQATHLDPDLYLAHFQLGLLYATSSRIKEAEQAWLALDKLEDDHPMNLFRKGLIHLAQDEFEEAQTHLQSGIESNIHNSELNQNMQNILDEVVKIRENIDSQRKDINDSTPEEEKENKSGNRFLLSAYNNDKKE